MLPDAAHAVLHHSPPACASLDDDLQHTQRHTGTTDELIAHANWTISSNARMLRSSVRVQQQPPRAQVVGHFTQIAAL
jgi:hypothetical protein